MSTLQPLLNKLKHYFYFLVAITLIGLLYIPRKLRLWEHRIASENDDENSQLLKQMGGFKKRRAHKNKTP